MPRKFDDAALSAGYLRSIAGQRKRPRNRLPTPAANSRDRNDVVRHGDAVYCRRCGHLQPERDGWWRRVRMRNGVTVVQFICCGCGGGRDQALRALGQRPRSNRQAQRHHEALANLYGPARPIAPDDAAAAGSGEKVFHDDA